MPDNTQAERIPLNKPYLHGGELVYIALAMPSGKISCDGMFSRQCHQYFELTDEQVDRVCGALAVAEFYGNNT